MSQRQPTYWTLDHGRWKGQGFCVSCNEPVPGGAAGADYCSYDCGTNFTQTVVPGPGERKPRWKHDCDRCIFLGRYTYSPKEVRGKPKIVDLYACPHPTDWELTSIIGRYSSKPDQYAASHPPQAFAGDPEEHFKRSERWYRVAIIRAQEKGIIP